MACWIEFSRTATTTVFALLVAVSCSPDQRSAGSVGGPGSPFGDVGNLRVHGDIVYDDGAPARGAWIELEWVEGGIPGFPLKKLSETIQTDGSFRIEKDGTRMLTARFLTTDSYPEQWGFSFYLNRLENGDDSLSIDRELRIVLSRMPDHPVNLDHLATHMTSAVSEPVRMVSLCDDGPRILRWNAVDDKLGPGFMTVQAMGGWTERMPSDREDQGRRRTPEDRWIVSDPVLRLLNCEPDEGFVLLPAFDNVDGSASVGFRRMNVAPKEGYTCDLGLSSNDGTGRMFFYFHSCGKYGKGVVSVNPSVRFIDGQEVLYSGFELFINPNGDRDLSYYH